MQEVQELEDPVKLLVDMAKQGKIDPWNVDVVEVADRFLQELERARRLDLRISGRVLLYAAILVRMKAEILAEEAIFSYDECDTLDVCELDVSDVSETYEHEFELQSEVEVEAEVEAEPLGMGEEDEVIAYLMSPHRKVRRFTTLKDLLVELKKAEKVKKKRKREDTGKKVLEIPHDEDMEETVREVEKVLERLFRERGTLLFSELVEGMPLREKLSYFVSLLYLSFRKKVEIIQERIYEDDIVILPSGEGDGGQGNRENR